MRNRVDRLVPRMTGNPTSNMRTLLEQLSPSTIIPEVNKYYVFVYKAKTPNIQYDAHPFVVCTSIYKWGFTGYNFHWEQSRRYTWQEVVSNLYEIYDSELNTMATLPIARFRNT